MQQYSNFDYLYALLTLVLALVMIFSPRTLMRGVKYDEESMKTEKWVKWVGIGISVFSIGFAIFIYIKLSNA